MKEKDQHIYKSHNKTLLLYHFVFPAKYRKEVFDPKVDRTLKEVCLGISDRYEIHFVEIGNDLDHVHFELSLTLATSPAEYHTIKQHR